MRKLLIHIVVALFVLGVMPALVAMAQTNSALPATPAPAATQRPQASKPTEPTPPRITAYTLPPQRAKQAHDIHCIYFRYQLITFCYGLVVLWIILRWRIGSQYRTWAEKISSRQIIQALVFAPLLMLTIDLLQLPPEIYFHWLRTAYGLSIQGWLPWFWDWTKGELVNVVIATILIWILYTLIRRSPRRWWLYFWAVSLPLGAFFVFLTPLVIDPLFHTFEPLAKKDPALTVALQNLVQRAGQTIPPERMFWMDAGKTTTTLNAYVTGLGASKRIVVWDTTIARMSTAQIVFVTGHEMGHYVLNHLLKGLAIAALCLLLAYYVGFRCLRWVLTRWGGNWGTRGPDDWASLPALLLLFSIFVFAGSPVAGAVSRYFEHQADQYALEVTHGLTPDSAQVGAQTFQILGDVGLADPDPSPVDIFMFYDHPPIRDRVIFSLTYDPWSQGQRPEFVSSSVTVP
jgi:Zn-dependent protease with chaperone function